EALAVLGDLLTRETAAEAHEEEAELDAAVGPEHRRTHGVDLVALGRIDVDEEVVVAAELVEETLEHAVHGLAPAVVGQLGQRLSQLHARVGVEAHRVAALADGDEHGLVAVELLFGGPRVLALEPSVDVPRRG